MEIGNELLFLGLQHGLGTPFGFHGNLVAAQRCLRLLEICFPAGLLCRETLFIGDGRLHLLLGGRLSREERLFASTLFLGSHNVRLNGADPCLGGDDLRFGLIDSRKCSLDARVLQLPLPPVVLNGRFGGFYRRARQRHLRLVVVILKFDQEIPGMHALKSRKLSHCGQCPPPLC